MVNYNLYTLLITIGILAPIIGSITLFTILAFEGEIDSLKNENSKVSLEKELQKSEYMQLNQQIHPHFLFNTMNLVIGLARLKKNEQLIEVLEHLSLFLKYKYKVKDPLIPLSQELEYTNHYLAIQQIRLGGRLHIFLDFVEVKDLDLLVPPYMLQTLVENAFKHSIEKKIGEVKLTIGFRTISDIARLEVIDNGIGLRNPNFKIEESSGHGLKNVLSRLQILFGEQASISLSPSTAGGTKVVVLWPIIKELNI